MLFDKDAVPDQRHLRPFRLVAQLDCQGVHRDRPDDPAARAAHENFGPGQPAPKAVSVAHRNEPDPSRSLGD